MSKLAISIDGHPHEVILELPLCGESTFSVTINGQELSVTLPDPIAAPDKTDWVVVNNRPYQINFDRDLRWIEEYRGLHHIEVRDLEVAVARPRSSDGRLKAPIPGLITRVLVSVGQHVEVGQPVLVLEAMKMEIEFRAPRAGIINGLHGKPGQTVSRNELLAEIV